jgi:Xaa-Pro aminopeptidase
LNTIELRLGALRERMRANGVDMYLIESEDFHGSEYVGDYFRCRAFISGFDGSAGTVIVTQTEAGLWTDGRYFL